MKITPEVLEAAGFIQGVDFPQPTWVYTAGPMLWVKFGTPAGYRFGSQDLNGDTATLAELIVALILSEREEEAEREGVQDFGR